MSTQDNLQEAFAGESQANRKYLAFAEKAEDEGFNRIAKLFRAAAAAETVHAHKHLNVMGGIKSTKENLEEAIEGETQEYTKMYPQMILEAEKEGGNEKAIQSFDFANKVESIHANLYRNALENMDNNESVDYYVCQVCGNTVENEAPDKCHICGALSSMFTKID
ncbi:MAG: rubrerythrin family protein [Candidatus Scalindua rubra]|uniref:Rubrerythrin n=1 Tax=Candidatus Scalindua brodae TaxID=237368 RepID=A0A0B0EKF3_9BACT|nr:MAG: rubrerythrin [Candidatus Scalindua brodae]MBZ0107115.1 rubrerythrin family protein [Candidatus Scalindua rubra]TWU38117.1 Rubrerythrin-2 [Candidatus Brocadiaceae bacterium S225]